MKHNYYAFGREKIKGMWGERGILAALHLNIPRHYYILLVMFLLDQETIIERKRRNI